MIFTIFATVHSSTADKTISKYSVTSEYAIQDARTQKNIPNVVTDSNPTLHYNFWKRFEYAYEISSTLRPPIQFPEPILPLYL
jgi:hypothetical protein